MSMVPDALDECFDFFVAPIGDQIRLRHDDDQIGGLFDFALQCRPEIAMMWQFVVLPNRKLDTLPCILLNAQLAAQFLFQMDCKVPHPPRGLVVRVGVAYEDVVFTTGEIGHRSLPQSAKRLMNLMSQLILLGRS